MVIGVSAGKPAINMSRSRYSYSLITSSLEPITLADLSLCLKLNTA